MENVNNIYYVYALIDSSTNTSFYIGKGKNNRMYDHVKHTKSGKISNNNRHLFNKINKLLKNDIDIKHIKLHENIEEREALRLESMTIKDIGLDKLCNMKSDGVYIEYSDELRKKMSDAHKGNIPWNKGKRNIYSDETLEKIRIGRSKQVSGMLGRKHTKETKQKMSDGKKGKNWEELYGEKKAKTMKNNSRIAKLGTKLSQESKDKISVRHKGRISHIKGQTWNDIDGEEKSNIIRKKLSQSRKGIIFSDEHRKNISKSLKGKSFECKFGKEKADMIRAKMSNSKMGEVKEVVTCPHCDKSGGKPVMYRFHFDNCKFKKTERM